MFPASRLSSRVWLLSAVLFFPVSLFADPASSPNGLAAQPKSAEIEALWNEGKKSKAEKLIDKWASEEKDSPWPLVQEAALSYREKKYSRALAKAKAALEKSPQCADAYFWKGQAYEAMNKPMDAANEYRAALIAQETYQEAREALDRVLEKLGS